MAGSAGLLREAVAHGGRLAAAMAAYPAARRPWIDLSTGINPEPWTGTRAPLEALARLPEPADLKRLEAVAAQAFGVADPSRVVATAGAETGLRWIARLMAVTDIEIVSPTYASHEQAWRCAGVEVRRIAANALAASTAEAALLVNPNNPDGHAVSRAELEAIVGARAAQGRWTIVDESFVETDPDLSVAATGADRLIVLRSFGKFYGLAGLRLGFVIAAPAVAAQLRALQGEWPVSAEAIFMGTQAYADADWQARNRAQLVRRAADLDGMLATAGLTVIGGSSLFRLASVPDAAAAFAGLCSAGVYTRPFADHPTWLRLGLPRAADLERVGVALRGLSL